MIKEPDFKAFKDWRVYGSAEPWPYFSEQDKELTVEQKKIVERNAELLLDSGAWRAHVGALEEQLALIEDKKKRSKVREIFQIRFDHHTFPDHEVNFCGRHFPCSVSFRGATFGDGDVWFARAIFEGGEISFGEVTFGDGDVWFTGATFGEGNVWFDNIELTAGSIFVNDIDVAGNLFVRSNTFRKEANFQRASVKGTADFSGNIFHEVPDFRDTVFASPPEVARMEVPPPKMKGKWAFKTAADGDDVAKYRKLKAMALAANDHEKDIEFFAYEMLAKRGYEKGSIKWYELLTNWLYFTFSNFGQSYWRPFCWMVFSFFSFFVIYAINAAPFLKPSELSTFARWHSLSNTFPFLSSLFRFAARPEGHPSGYDEIFHKLAHDGGPVDWLVYLGIFQNFIGLILLFLLLLGLRNKFRLK